MSDRGPIVSWQAAREVIGVWRILVAGIALASALGALGRFELFVQKEASDYEHQEASLNETARMVRQLCAKSKTCSP